MGADLPHTLYRKSGGKAATQDDVDDATEKMREAYERRKAATDAEGNDSAPTVEDVFAGALEE